MTTLLSIIVFCLIVLIILAGIGVFNLRCICNFCDFIIIEIRRNQGTLNSINATLSQIQINQAQDNNQIIEHIKAVFDGLKVATIRLEDIRDNTAYEPDDFTTDDDLPFPEDEKCDEPTPDCEREHFVLTGDTDADAIIEAYKNEIIAIYCANEDEWKESVDFISSLGITTNDNLAPNACDEIGYGDVVSCIKFVNCHAIQSIGFSLCLAFEIAGLKGKNNFVQGNVDNMKEHYDILEWSDIRDFIQTDEEFEPAEVAKFVEENGIGAAPDSAPVVVGSDEFKNLLDTAAETCEMSANDAAPVNPDTVETVSEDEGEANA